MPFEVLLQPGPFPPRAKRKAEEDDEAAIPQLPGGRRWTDISGLQVESQHYNAITKRAGGKRNQCS